MRTAERRRLSAVRRCFARSILGEALVDRPTLILSSLMMVLGLQIISVELIGQSITFTQEHVDYKVERIVD